MKPTTPHSAKKIVIFASGKGSNTKNIIEYFSSKKNVKIVHVLSNDRCAHVLRTAHELNVSALHFDKSAFYETNEVLNVLKDANPDLIVLAGFLWMVPKKIIRVFPNKIINIHPALLPSYGGKGMYGSKVHQAVLNNEESETGISIHYVNEHYDEGKVIAQFKVPVHPEDNLTTLTQKIKKLEHQNFPKVIEKILIKQA